MWHRVSTETWIFLILTKTELTSCYGEFSVGTELQGSDFSTGMTLPVWTRRVWRNEFSQPSSACQVSSQSSSHPGWGFLCGPGVLAGGLTRQAYSITETAPLFCRHRKNKRRALMRVQEAHLPDSLGPDPPWAYAASGSTAVPPLRLQPSISLCLITFVLASAGALQRAGYSFS